MSNTPSAAVADLRSIPALHRDVREWYRKHRRDLPWRRTRDPYRIWVSEVMLQQTQVKTALPFYQRFLERFPTLDRLARAREASVLAAWSGLGYYRRARHLHAAARTIVRDHAGRVPADESSFGGLPGVGRYTRGAVLSIAFDRALPVLDGNVARVLARLAARPWSVRDPRGAKSLWTLAEQLVPMRGAGEWNQALMELGAMVCTPRTPQCGSCPVQHHCAAFARGSVARYPGAASTRPGRRHYWAAAVVRDGDRVLLVRRQGSLLRGMWEPPILDVRSATSLRTAGDRVSSILRGLGVRTSLTPMTGRIRHRITHRDIVVGVWTGRARATLAVRSDVRWVRIDRPAVPMSGLGRKLVRAALHAFADWATLQLE